MQSVKPHLWMSLAWVALASAANAVAVTPVASAAPAVLADDAPSQALVDAAVQKACALLLSNQELYVPDPPVGVLPDDELTGWQAKEGGRLAGLRSASAGEGREWPYEGVYRVGPDGRIPPGYRVGGTAIVCEALFAAPGFDDARRQAVLRGVVFMLDMIADDPGLAARAQTAYDVRGWGQAYALSFFVRAGGQGLFAGDEQLATRVGEAIPELIGRLAAGQLKGGGWNYAGRSSSSPFMTGATLLALFSARAAGHDVDAGMVARALDALEAGRGASSAYAYSGSSGKRPEPMQGAAARSAMAELALFLGGRSDAERLAATVDGFLAEQNWQALLQRKSQQGTHKPPFGVAPYYFFFGHTYAAVAAEHLPEPSRAARRERMRVLLWRTLEQRGGWNDRVFPRTESYSTAMAVLALLAPRLPPQPRWQAAEPEAEAK
ncbi:MAG: hypothetical protein DRQ55_01360 [Planctomycetota bacterium]|nr:MAG: hypothetical protein DRQ55_01360 [Planctomycetota bacterium]